MISSGLHGEDRVPIPQDWRKLIRQLADHLRRLGILDYLASEQFSQFCRAHGIYEMWDGLLGLSRDKPDLYGNDTVNNAFFMLLQQIYRERGVELPGILADLLADYSGIPLNPSFFVAIQRDLIHLGYFQEDVENRFAMTGGRPEDLRTGYC